MGFFTNWFNSSPRHLFHDSVDFDLDLLIKEREETEKIKQLMRNSNAKFENHLHEIKMKELFSRMDAKMIEDNVSQRKDKLNKLRNPKSIYLRKKKAT